MKLLLSLLSTVFAVLLSYKEIHAESFVNIVNPVRISLYNQDPLKSLETQYRLTKEFEFKATWLVTYDVLEKSDLVEFLKSMKDQEFGIFLEVGEELANSSGVDFKQKGSWHYASSLFLSGYSQKDRKLLVDKLFSRFKEVFGYYPKSVGSWWTDSYSLNYMQKKYEVSANLGVSDQFSTDQYQVWGQYFSVPFYPSLYHSGIPAQSVEKKIDVVNLQWAPRDPLNGYKSSLYSTQDYHVYPVNKDISYFEKIFNLYLNEEGNSFSQVTVGLEADLEYKAYEREYKKQLELISQKQKKANFKVVQMSEFSKWYKDKFSDVSPPHTIFTKDILGTDKLIAWYMSPRYRIGITTDLESHKTKVFDLRFYSNQFLEPYYFSPNESTMLSIYMPSIFDEAMNSDLIWPIEMGKFLDVNKDTEVFTLKFENGNLEFTKDYFLFPEFIEIPSVISSSRTSEVKKLNKRIEIHPQSNWISNLEGYTFSALTSEATHFIKSKKVIVAIVILFFLVLLAVLSKLRTLTKLVVVLLFILSTGFYYMSNTQTYLVTPAEVDALLKLSQMPGGRVVVFDNECLQCGWHTTYKPAVFSNKKGYVTKLSNHQIVYNRDAFEASTRETAKRNLIKTGAKYVYLVKHEKYEEKLPFSPGDLGVEQVYSNANSEIWKIKN